MRTQHHVRVLGPDHPQTLVAWKPVGRRRRQVSMTSEERKRPSVGPPTAGSRCWAKTASGHGDQPAQSRSFLIEHGNAAEGVPLAQDASAWLDTVNRPEGDSKALVARSVLAYGLEDQGDLDGAERLLRESPAAQSVLAAPGRRTPSRRATTWRCRHEAWTLGRCAGRMTSWTARRYARGWVPTIPSLPSSPELRRMPAGAWPQGRGKTRARRQPGAAGGALLARRTNEPAPRRSVWRRPTTSWAWSARPTNCAPGSGDRGAGLVVTVLPTITAALAVAYCIALGAGACAGSAPNSSS